MAKELKYRDNTPIVVEYARQVIDTSSSNEPIVGVWYGGGEIFDNVVNDDESNSLTNNNSFKVKVIAMHISPSNANFLMSTIHDFYLSGADFIDSNTTYLIHKGKQAGLAIGDFPTIKIIEIEANGNVESWKSQKHEVGQILAVMKIE